MTVAAEENAKRPRTEGESEKDNVDAALECCIKASKLLKTPMSPEEEKNSLFSTCLKACEKKQTSSKAKGNPDALSLALDEDSASKQLPVVLQNAPLTEGLSFGHHGDFVDFKHSKPAHCNGELMTWEEWSEMQQSTSPPVMHVSRSPIAVTEKSWVDRLTRWKNEEQGRDERLENKAVQYGNEATRSRCLAKVREVLDHEPSLGGAKKALEAARKALTDGHGTQAMVEMIGNWIAHRSDTA